MKRTVDSLNGGPTVTLTPGTVAGQVLVSVGEDAAYLYSVDLLLGEVLWVTGYQRGEVLRRRERTVIPVEVVPGLSIEIPTDLLADLTDDERVECIEAARREVERRATTMRIWRSRQAEHEETRRRHRPVIEDGNVVEVRPDVQPVPSDVLYLGHLLGVDLYTATDEVILSRSVGVIVSGEAMLNGALRRFGMRYTVTDEAAQAVRDAIEAARACGDLPDDDEDTEP